MGKYFSLGLQHGLLAVTLGSLYAIPIPLALKIASTAVAALWLYCRYEDSYREALMADDERRFLVALTLAIARSQVDLERWNENRTDIEALINESNEQAQLQLIMGNGLRPMQLVFVFAFLGTVAGAFVVATIAAKL